MAFDFEKESDNFFGALKPLVPEGIAIAHKCFEQVLIKSGRIKAGEYDKKKGAVGIEVTSLKIFDEIGGFRLEITAPNGTPALDELENTIDKIQALMSSLHVYSPNPCPDERIEANITVENMPFFSGVFSISLDVKRYRNGKYIGYIFVNYEDILLNFEEVTRLLETAVKRSPVYYTAFVGYGEPDKDFAKKLVVDLKKNAVSCWLFLLDHTPGERTWTEIGRKRREAEKTIVICSARSLIRDGLLKELEEQIDDDPNKLIPISKDNLWKEQGFVVQRAGRNLKPFLTERNYADFSFETNYQKALGQLLKALERKET